MKRLFLILICLLFAAPGWGADLNVCAAGCDGTVANFEAGDSPFNDLSGDTVTFTDSAISDVISLADVFGSQESERATLIFTDVTVTDDAANCIETNGRDYITIVGGTWVGGDGSNACIDVETNSIGITLDGITVYPGASDRGIQVSGGSHYFIVQDSTIDGDDSSSTLFHLYLSAGQNINNFKILRNTLMDSGGISINIQCAGTTSYINTVEISYNTITGGVHQGIRVWPNAYNSTESYGVDVHDNIITDTGNYAIVLGRVTSTGGTSYIRRNVITNINLTLDSNNVNAIGTEGCNGIIVEDNVVNGNSSGSGDGNCIIIDHTNYGGGVAKSDGVIVRRNKVSGCTDETGSGISVYNATNTEVYNNLSYSNLNGINFDCQPNDGSCTGNVFYNNTLANNSQDGAVLKASNIGNSTWTNNIFYGNTDDGFDDDSTGGTHTLIYNINNGNGTAYEGSTSCGIGCLTSDPLFIDAANGNFALQSGSPAIDAGETLSIHTELLFDGFGYGDGFDIGAEEHRGSSDWPPLPIVFDTENKIVAWYVVPADYIFYGADGITFGADAIYFGN